MTTTSMNPAAPPPKPPAAAHYKEPDWFTRHIFNNVVKGLTRLGVSVWGSRVLEHRGRTTGKLHHVPVNLLTIEGTQYLVAPAGRDPVGAQRAPRRRPPGADPRAAAPAVHGQRGPGRPTACRSCAPTSGAGSSRSGMFFDGVTPDSTDAEWAAVAADHPVFVLR